MGEVWHCFVRYIDGGGEAFGEINKFESHGGYLCMTQGHNTYRVPETQIQYVSTTDQHEYDKMMRNGTAKGDSQ